MKHASRPLTLGLATAFALLILPSAALANGNVSIRDDANVLTTADRQSITDAAHRAPFGVAVVTVNGGYAGNKPAFVSYIDNQVRNDVVIAVDPKDHFSHVAAQRNTGLTAAATVQAQEASKADFTAGRWGPGIVAAINSLTQSASAPRGGVAAANPQPSSSNAWGGPATLLILGVALVVIVGVVVWVIRRVLRGRSNQGGYVGGGYGPGAQPGTGYGQPGYGPMGQQGGGGLGGSFLAGGLGALGGGLLGYELGKQAGEHQQGGDFGNSPSGDGGGIVESDTGSGSEPDFGGGDFGGGDSGGGGGDF